MAEIKDEVSAGVASEAVERLTEFVRQAVEESFEDYDAISVDDIRALLSDHKARGEEIERLRGETTDLAGAIDDWEDLADDQGRSIKALEEALLTGARYLTRLESALLADDLDMKLNFPGEPSPTAMAETMLPGFDSVAYAMDVHRAALTAKEDTDHA